MSGVDARDLLRRLGLRVTPQRRAIIEAFQGGSAEHLSADEVHSRASVVVPEIGRGTVYATLAELTELGLLSSVGNPEPVRYETNLAAHDHFRCRLCMRLFDVDLGGQWLAARPLAGFLVDDVSIIAQGVCAECRDYERGLQAGAAQIMERPLLASAELSDLACARVDTPLGDLAVAASASGIVRVAFERHADYDELLERSRTRRGPGDGRTRIGEFGRALQRYFNGSPQVLVDPIDWRLSTARAADALAAVTRIAYDGSLSYERIMGDLSPEECGRAMGANPLPLLVPCHRVSCGSDRPDTYVGGAQRLRLLRTLEAG